MRHFTQRKTRRMTSAEPANSRKNLALQRNISGEKNRNTDTLECWQALLGRRQSATAPKCGTCDQGQ